MAERFARNEGIPCVVVVSLGTHELQVCVCHHAALDSASIIKYSSVP